MEGLLSANASAQNSDRVDIKYAARKVGCQDKYQERIRKKEEFEAGQRARGKTPAKPIISREFLERQRDQCLKNVAREYERRKGG